MNMETRKIVEINEDKCNGCGICVEACAEGAIQIINGKAQFLKGAELLIAADCTPVAYPFFQHLIKNKVVLIGCPKFDDIQRYIQKFVAIFQKAEVKKITVAVMEVPCCQGLPVIVQKAMDISGKSIPMETIVVSTKGKLMISKADHLI